MDEAEIEMDASMDSWVMDPIFPDAQQDVQNREADALERVRSFVGDQVSVEVAEELVSFAPSAQPDPNLAGHQRPEHTMRLNQVEGSSQIQIEFNSQPGVSSRGSGIRRGPGSSRTMARRPGSAPAQQYLPYSERIPLILTSRGVARRWPRGRGSSYGDFSVPPGGSRLPSSTPRADRFEPNFSHLRREREAQASLPR